MEDQPTVAAYNATEEAADGLFVGQVLAGLQGSEPVIARVLRDVVAHGEEDRAAQRKVRAHVEETHRAVVAAVPNVGDAEVVPVIDQRLARGLHEFAAAENAAMLVLGSSHLGPLGRRLTIIFGVTLVYETILLSRTREGYLDTGSPREGLK